MALRLRGATSGYIELKAPASAGDNTLTLPTNNGSANQLLKTDGSGNLSWVDDNSGVSLSGSTNNTIATVTGANALIGEANLTFDGTTLKVAGGSNTTQAVFSGTGGSGARGLEIVTEAVGAADEGVIFNARASGTTGRLKFNTNGATAMTILGNGGKVGIGTTDPVGGDFVVENTSGTAAIALSRVFSGNVANSAVNTPSFAFTLSDTATNDQVVASISPQALAGTGDAFKGHMRIFTANDAGTNTERLRIENNGDVTIQDGDLKIGTAGHGINFSAYATAASGSGSPDPSSNLLDDYEEGMWTPETVTGTWGQVTGYYTKIGQQVFLTAYMYGCDTTSGSDQVKVDNLPFAPISSMTCGVAITEASNPFTVAYMNGSGYILLAQNEAASSIHYMEHSDISAGGSTGRLHINANYRTNA